MTDVIWEWALVFHTTLSFPSLVTKLFWKPSFPSIHVVDKFTGPTKIIFIELIKYYMSLIS